MIRCSQCGGKLRRMHRTVGQRLRYLAIYRCRECEAESFVARHYVHHFGPHCRCPRCGTYRLSRLRERDKIDRMQGGLLNLLERLAGGRLFHCRYCRLQFYDRRPPAPEAAELAAQELGIVRK